MKVFCVGAWKSGTTSMGQALHFIMGGNHKSWGLRQEYLNGEYKKILHHAKAYRTFDDTPWNCKEVIERVYVEFPYSKFILPIRKSDEWFESMVKWYDNDIRKGSIGPKESEREMKSYGEYSLVAEMYKRQMQPTFDALSMNPMRDHRNRWIQWYELRNKRLKNMLGNRVLPVYFSKDKPLDWEPICTFLNKPIPDLPFPYKNQYQYIKKDKSD